MNFLMFWYVELFVTMTCVLSPCILRLKFCFQSMFEMIPRIIAYTISVRAKYLFISMIILIMAVFNCSQVVEV